MKKKKNIYPTETKKEEEKPYTLSTRNGVRFRYRVTYLLGKTQTSEESIFYRPFPTHASSHLSLTLISDAAFSLPFSALIRRPAQAPTKFVSVFFFFFLVC